MSECCECSARLLIYFSESKRFKVDFRDKVETLKYRNEKIQNSETKQSNTGALSSLSVQKGRVSVQETRG